MRASPAAQVHSYLSKPGHPRFFARRIVIRTVFFVKNLFTVNCNAVPFLLVFFQHCDTVTLVVVNKTAVPILKGGKESVSTVLFIGLFGTEGYIIRKFLEI